MSERLKASDRPHNGSLPPRSTAPVFDSRYSPLFTLRMGRAAAASWVEKVTGRGLELYQAGSDVDEDNHTPRNGQFIIAVSRSKGADASWKAPHEPPPPSLSQTETGMYESREGEKRRGAGRVREKRATRGEEVDLSQPYRAQRLRRTW